MRIVSWLVAFALCTSTTLTADAGPLTPGKPAGVKHAQSTDNNVLLLGVLGAGAVAFLGLVIAQGGSTTLPKTVVQSTSTTGTTS